MSAQPIRGRIIYVGDMLGKKEDFYTSVKVDSAAGRIQGVETAVASSLDTFTARPLIKAAAFRILPGTTTVQASIDLEVSASTQSSGEQTPDDKESNEDES